MAYYAMTITRIKNSVWMIYLYIIYCISIQITYIIIGRNIFIYQLNSHLNNDIYIYVISELNKKF